MAQLIEEKFGVDATRILRDYWVDKIAIVWTAQDVMGIPLFTEDERYPTKDQAIEVLNRALEEYDCNNGITWDKLEEYVRELTVPDEDHKED